MPFDWRVPVTTGESIWSIIGRRSAEMSTSSLKEADFGGDYEAYLRSQRYLSEIATYNSNKDSGTGPYAKMSSAEFKTQFDKSEEDRSLYRLERGLGPEKSPTALALQQSILANYARSPFADPKQVAASQKAIDDYYKSQIPKDPREVHYGYADTAAYDQAQRYKTFLTDYNSTKATEGSQYFGLNEIQATSKFWESEDKLAGKASPLSTSTSSAEAPIDNSAQLAEEKRIKDQEEAKALQAGLFNEQQDRQTRRSGSFPSVYNTQSGSGFVFDTPMENILPTSQETGGTSSSKINRLTLLNEEDGGLLG